MDSLSMARYPMLDKEVHTMAMKIIADECIACGACEPDCPTESVQEVEGVYVIDASTCVECDGYYDEPQCVSVCPVDCVVAA